MKTEIVDINGVQCLYIDVGDGNAQINIGSTEKVPQTGVHLIYYTNGYSSVMEVVITEFGNRLTSYNSELTKLIMEELSEEEVFQYSLLYANFDTMYAAKKFMSEQYD